jgi:DNA-binding CsgD family transcriptional regulator
MGVIVTEHIDSLHNRTVLPGLDKVINAIGTPSFQKTVTEILRATAEADYCHVAKLSRSGRLQVLFRGGTIVCADELIKTYYGGLYRADPNIKMILQSPSIDPVILPLSRNKNYTRQYINIFFTLPKLVDKFATARCIDGGWLYSNFYRFEGKKPFSKSETAEIRSSASIFAAAIAKHNQLTFKEKSEDKESSIYFDEILKTSPRFAQLSERERKVCYHILLGCTSEAIGMIYGISTNSVLSYRKRAYSKLNICSSSQLFSLVLETRISASFF